MSEKNNSSALEIGSSNGYLLGKLKEKDWKVLGNVMIYLEKEKIILSENQVEKFAEEISAYINNIKGIIQ